MKKISEMTSSELFVEMSNNQRDDIYRMVWSDHVYEDCKAQINERELSLDDEEVDAICEEVANNYVYNGRYDCNLSYWDNIDNLINESLSDK